MAPPWQDPVVAPEPPQEEQVTAGGGGGGDGQPGGGGGDGGLAFKLKVGFGVAVFFSLAVILVFMVSGSVHQTGDTPPPSQSPSPSP